MGHCTCIRVYPATTDAKTISADMNDIARCNSDTRSGLDKPIRFLNIVCNDDAEAEKRIRENDKGWYDQLAVKYYEYKSNETKKYLAAKAKLDELNKEFRELDRTKLEIKTDFVTCKHCKSKINSKYFYNHNCPLCKKDARPQTLLNKLKKLQEKIAVAVQKVREASTKELYWMVKIEYHV